MIRFLGQYMHHSVPVHVVIGEDQYMLDNATICMYSIQLFLEGRLVYVVLDSFFRVCVFFSRLDWLWTPLNLLLSG